MASIGKSDWSDPSVASWRKVTQDEPELIQKGVFFIPLVHMMSGSDVSSLLFFISNPPLCLITNRRKMMIRGAPVTISSNIQGLLFATDTPQTQKSLLLV